MVRRNSRKEWNFSRAPVVLPSFLTSSRPHKPSPLLSCATCSVHAPLERNFEQCSLSRSATASAQACGALASVNVAEQNRRCFGLCARIALPRGERRNEQAWKEHLICAVPWCPRLREIAGGQKHRSSSAKRRTTRHRGEERNERWREHVYVGARRTFIEEQEGRRRGYSRTEAVRQGLCLLDYRAQGLRASFPLDA